MLPGVVFEPFGESEIDDVEVGVFFIFAAHEIFRFDVSVEEAFGVELVELRDLLIYDHEDAFEGQ